MNSDFIGIKIGDVNGTAVANSLLGTEGRSAGSFGLEVDNRILQAGETTTVHFTANHSQVQGYQFTLEHAGLELNHIEAGAAKQANFGLFEGATTVSWNEKTASTQAFSLVFTASEAVLLSDALQLTSSRTQAESYTNTGEVEDIKLYFHTTGFALYQNTPNPFDEVTLISFALPSAQSASLTVTDAAGKVLRVIEQDFAAGYNQIELSAKSLATGVLSYTLATKDFTATKKMVILE